MPVQSLLTVAPITAAKLAPLPTRPLIFLVWKEGEEKQIKSPCTRHVSFADPYPDPYFIRHLGSDPRTVEGLIVLPHGFLEVFGIGSGFIKK